MEQTENVPSGEVCLTDLENELNVSKAKPKKSKKRKKLSGITLFHKVKERLGELYDLRFDSIKLEIEIADKGKNNFRILNDSNLYVEIREGDFNISKSDLREILK